MAGYACPILFQEGGDVSRRVKRSEADGNVPLAAGLTQARPLLRPAGADAASGRGQHRLLPGRQRHRRHPEHALATRLELSVPDDAHAEVLLLGQAQHLCLNDEENCHSVGIRHAPRLMNGSLDALYGVQGWRAATSASWQEGPPSTQRS